MGIPKYFRAISERFPLINQSINMGLKPEIDCLYLDMNGIVHTATHANGSNDIDSLSEDEMFLQIFQYIEQLLELAEPQKLLYMALDGVAPRAKMNQQRQRRFRSGQALQQKIDAEIQKNDSSSSSQIEVFDTNCITPGTEFMDRLSAHIQYYINRRMSQDKKWQKLKVIFSGADSIGEGEHKIMAYIRSQRMQPDYNPNLRHCIYGLDADLIMLSLVSHEHNTVLLREEVIFGDQSDKYKKRKHLLKPGQFVFLHISIFREYINYDLNFAAEADWYDLDRVIDDFVLLSYLAGNDFLPSIPTIRIGLGSLDVIFAVYRKNIVEMGGYLTSFGSINIERLIKYFGLLSQHEPALFHVVNDDIQRIAEFKAEQESSMSDLTEGDDAQNYALDPVTGMKYFSRRLLEKNEEKLQEPNIVSVDELFQLFDDDDKTEEQKNGEITQTQIDALASEKAAQFIDKLTDHANATSGDGFNMLSLEDLVAEDDQRAPKGQDSFDVLLKKGFYYDEDTDEMIPIGTKYDIHNYYHKALPDVARGGKKAVYQLCLDYIEGLYWVYKYYYQGVPSWKWQFPYYEAPTLTSLSQIDPKDCKFEFDIGTPFTPLQQLMGVLPPQSAGLLPEPLRCLMLNPESPIADFYPLGFEVDMTGKRWEHEGVAKIPFIDEVRLISAMQNAVPNLINPFGQDGQNNENDQNNNKNSKNLLKPNQIRRNINSAGDMLFSYDPSLIDNYSLIAGYTQILNLTKQVPQSHLELYRGNPERSNQLYFADIPRCPVKIELFVNVDIPQDPQHFFSVYGKFSQTNLSTTTTSPPTPIIDSPSCEYIDIITSQVMDNPFVLKEYKKDRILTAFEEAKANDKKYLTGKILSEPTFISTRILLSQQPLPGYPSLKPIMESYGELDEALPIRIDESAIIEKKFDRHNGGKYRGNNNNGQINLDLLFGDEKKKKKETKKIKKLDENGNEIEGEYEEVVVEDEDEAKVDPNAPYLLFGRPPITIFGKKSLMPSLSIHWTHDTHTKMLKYKYLEKYRQNDGLNPPLISSVPVLPSTYSQSFTPMQFNHLISVADRFSPGRIVWCDFPFLRPGRIEWICDGDNVILPINRTDYPNSNTSSPYYSPSSGQKYKIIPITAYHKRLYQNEQQTAMARYKHMLGLQPEIGSHGSGNQGQKNGKVIVCIAPLLNMIQGQDGSLTPVYDTIYHSRKTAQQSSQNGISFQHGNLNPLPGLLFNIPQLLWATPPMQPDPRWTKLSRQPTTGMYSTGTKVIGLTQDTYAYLGQVQEVLKPSDLQQMAQKMIKNGKKPDENGLTYEKLNHMVSKQEDMIKVNWHQIPPPVQIQLQNVNGEIQLLDRQNIFFQIAEATKLRFFPGFELARALGITGKTLYRITDSIFFKVGYRQYNFGLQFHANRHSLLLPDYTRYVNQWLIEGENGANPQPHERSIGNGGDRWEYSNLAVILIKKFQKAFPELFSYLDNAAANVDIEGNIDIGQMLITTWLNRKAIEPEFEVPYEKKHQIPMIMIESYQKKVKEFIETLGLGEAVMVSTTSRQLNTVTVRQLETLILSSLTKPDEDNVQIQATSPGQRGQSISLNVGQIKKILEPTFYDSKIQKEENYNQESIIFDPQQLLLPSSTHPYCPLETLRNDQIILSGMFDQKNNSNNQSQDSRSHANNSSKNQGQNNNNKQQFFRLCDRVMISRSDSRVPLGTTGTIVGLHSQFMPLTSFQAESGQFELSIQGGKDLFVEILLDAPSLVATKLRGKCLSPLGVLVPATCILNLTQPVWMLESQVLAAEEHQQDQQYQPQQQQHQRSQQQHQRSQQQQQQQRQPKQQQQQQRQLKQQQQRQEPVGEPVDLALLYQQPQPQQQGQPKPQQQQKPQQPKPVTATVATPVVATSAVPVPAVAPVVPTPAPVVAQLVAATPAVVQPAQAKPTTTTPAPVVLAPQPEPTPAPTAVSPTPESDKSIVTPIDSFLDEFM